MTEDELADYLVRLCVEEIHVVARLDERSSTEDQIVLDWLAVETTRVITEADRRVAEQIAD
jgi:hypothetical protein